MLQYRIFKVLKYQPSVMKSYLTIWTNLKDWKTYKQVPLPEQKIQQISIGQKHILLRTQNRILGIGSNSVGQLGVDDFDDPDYQKNFRQFIKIPTVQIKSKIKQISCGWSHTLILDNNGNIYSSGDGKNGALGHGRGIDSYGFKPIVGNLQNIREISAGKDHSLAISSTKVYGWGNSKDGQLGLVKQKIYFQPQQLYVYPTSICYAGAKYSAFNTNKGVYVTGCNQGGQLGLGHTNKIKLPKKISYFDSQIISIGGSSEYIVIKTKQNQYYISGTGNLGQFLYFTKIKQFKNSQVIYFGEQFGVSKSAQNMAYSWNAPYDSQPIQNPYLERLGQKFLTGGPSIVASVYTQGQVERPPVINLKNVNKQKSATGQRGEVKMVKSSIQYNNHNKNHIFTESIPNSIDNQSLFHQNETKARKQSQAVGARQSQNTYNGRYGSYNTSQQQVYQNNQYPYAYPQTENDRNSNYQRQNSQNEDVKSPHFKKQLSNRHSNSRKHSDSNGDYNQDNRISGFEGYQLQDRVYGFNHPDELPTNILNRQRSIETIQQENSPLGYTNNMTSKTISRSASNRNKQIKVKQINPSQESQLYIRLKYLQKENKKKDEYIRQIRKQFIELVQIVDSDMCLKKILEQKQRGYISRKKQELNQFQPQYSDAFQKNMKVLKGILGKTVESMTYDSLSYSN